MICVYRINNLKLLEYFIQAVIMSSIKSTDFHIFETFADEYLNVGDDFQCYKNELKALFKTYNKSKVTLLTEYLKSLGINTNTPLIKGVGIKEKNIKQKNVTETEIEKLQKKVKKLELENVKLKKEIDNKTIANKDIKPVIETKQTIKVINVPKEIVVKPYKIIYDGVKDIPEMRNKAFCSIYGDSGVNILYDSYDIYYSLITSFGIDDNTPNVLEIIRTIQRFIVKISTKICIDNSMYYGIHIEIVKEIIKFFTEYIKKEDYIHYNFCNVFGDFKINIPENIKINKDTDYNKLSLVFNLTNNKIPMDNFASIELLKGIAYRHYVLMYSICKDNVANFIHGKYVFSDNLMYFMDITNVLLKTYSGISNDMIV